MALASRKVQVLRPVPTLIMDDNNMPVEATKRVAAYCRVSTDSICNGRSIWLDH